MILSLDLAKYFIICIPFVKRRSHSDKKYSSWQNEYHSLWTFYSGFYSVNVAEIIYFFKTLNKSLKKIDNNLVFQITSLPYPVQMFYDFPIRKFCESSEPKMSQWASNAWLFCILFIRICPLVYLFILLLIFSSSYIFLAEYKSVR